MKNIYLVSRTIKSMKNEISKEMNKIEIAIDPFYQLKKTSKFLNEVDEISNRMYNNHLENGWLLGDIMDYKCWITKACRTV